MRSDAVEHILATHGIEYEYLDSVLLTKVDSSEHHQARFATDEDHVVALGVSMEAGFPIPPIVVSLQPGGRLRLLDGYHRINAARLTERETLDAYVVRRMTPAQTEALLAEANSKHGLPPTKAERLFEGVRLVDLGYTAADASKMVGVKAGQLTKRVAEEKAQRRIAGLGLAKVADSISGGHRIRMDSIRDDGVLREAVVVVRQSKLSYPAVSEMVSAINRAHSVEEQMAVVRAVETRYQGVIKTTAGGKVIYPHLQRLSRLLAGLLGTTPTSIEVDKMHPEHKRALRAQLTRAQTVLARVETRL